MFGPHDPETERLAAFMAALRRRVRATAAADAALVAGMFLLATTIAGISTGLGSRIPVLGFALAIGSGVGLWRLFALRRTWSVPAIARIAEEGLPALRNQLVTAIELAAHPERASAPIRSRVNAYATAVVERASIETVRPVRPVVARVVGTALAVVLASAVNLAPWGARPAAHRDAAKTAPPRAAAPAGISRVDIIVTPPNYAGTRAQTTRDPARLEALAGSALMVCVTAGAPWTTIDYAGSITAPARTHDGTSSTTLGVDRSGLLSIAARDATGTVVDRRLIPVVVRPDAPPHVVIEHPRSDLVLASPAERVRFTTRATDDLGLASLTLHYTKVTGSGEQYEFNEGELPLAISRERPDRWQGQSTQALTGLGLREGNLLVVYARAKDRRPKAEAAVSDSYVIEIGEPQAAIAGGFAVPADEDRAAISLSALIQKTERLHAQRAQLAASTFSEQAAGLAVEQRMVRTETLFLMGAHGEVEDEEAEAEHSNEIQEGRLENRGQTELRSATRLMSAAERSLLLADTGAALPPQRAALAAMQRALSKQRYFLRTLPVRGQIDPTRRLTGDLSTAASWARPAEAAAPDERIAAIRGMLAELARLASHNNSSRMAPHFAPHPGPLPASGERGTDGDAVAALAGRILALDPTSIKLAGAARELMELASATTASAARRRDAISKIVQTLEDEVSRSPSTTAVPPAFSTTPLRGAQADALRQSGARR